MWVTVRAVTRLVIEMNDDVNVDDVISEMAYDFTSQTAGAKIISTEIVDHEETNRE